jgi:starch-binding outer membrane protein, SusD/RagB family
MKKLLIPLAIIALLTTACQKYVDIQTKGQLIPSETDNYRYLMNNFSTLNKADGYTDWATDDIDLADAAQQQALATYEPYSRYYTWAEKLYDAASQDYNWNGFYNIIYTCNTVVDGVLESNNGTQADKQQSVW